MKSELRISRSTLAGLVLTLVGAVLDFYSGYVFLTLTTTTVERMGVAVSDYNSSALTWGIALSVLGGVLLITAVASMIFSSTVKIRMGAFFGFVMMGYGAIMLLVGGAMYFGATPMMEGSGLSSFGMFVVGLLMAVNGLVMTRKQSTM